MNYRRYALLVLWSWHAALPGRAHAATPAPPGADSLLRALRTAPAGPARVELLLALGQAYREPDSARARRYAEWAQSRARLLGNDTLEARALVARALVLQEQPAHGPAAEAGFRQALALFQRAGQGRQAARCYRNLGNLYKSQHRYAAARQAHEHDLALARQSGDRRREMGCYNNLGNVYSEQGQVAPALNYLLQSLRLAGELGDSAQIGLVAHNIGLLYQGLADTARTRQYFVLALRGDRGAGDSAYVASSLANLALFYLDGDAPLGPDALRRARRCLAEAVALHRHLGPRARPDQRAFVAFGLGKLAARRRRWREALRHYAQAETTYRQQALTEQHIGTLEELARTQQRAGQSGPAWAWARQALAEARQLAQPELLRDTYRLLDELSTARGDYRAAHAYQALAQVQQDTLFNQRKAGQMTELQLRYHSQEQKNQIGLLRRNARLQRARVALAARNMELQRRGHDVFLALLLVVLVALAVHATMAVRGYRRQRRSIALLQNQETELAARNERLTATEQQLRKLLGEKDVLLKEVHHRVKNNLQIVSSLLALQALDKQDALPPLGVALRESQNWVRAIALIHETLYHSDNLACLDVEAFLRQLVAALENAFTVGGAPHFASEVAAPGVQLNPSTAVPLGLIVNELVTNVYKHAFGHPAPPGARLRVGLVPGPAAAEYTLTVADNGRGLPPRFDPDQAASLGLPLVQRLAEQLDGHLHLGGVPGGGTCFTVVFREITETALPAEEPPARRFVAQPL